MADLIFFNKKKLYSIEDVLKKKKKEDITLPGLP